VEASGPADITGWGGTNRYWDRVTHDGQSGYLADVWLDTGGDITAQVPACSNADSRASEPNHTTAPLTDTEPDTGSETSITEPGINPAWEKAHAFFQGPQNDATHARTVSKGAVAPTPDDGIVMLRVFIPHQDAAKLLGFYSILKGDGRGFSDDPAMPSRAVLAWNTATGDVALDISPSTGSDGEVFNALPLTQTTDMADAFAVRDQVRYDNRLGLDPASKRKTELHARLSLLNSVTNGHLFGGKPLKLTFDQGAWSVDQEFTITRKGPGDYRLSQLEGNGYPAIEAYYYPKHPEGSNRLSTTIARRSVSPMFQHSGWDEGGGEAALDNKSWNTCTSTTSTDGANRPDGANGSNATDSQPVTSVTSVTCRNTIGTSVLVRPGFDSIAPIYKTVYDVWTTKSEQTDALSSS
jgi:hypothetical protein